MSSITVNNLAELYEDQSQFALAAKMYERGLVLSRQVKNPNQEFKALLGLANWELHQGLISEAKRKAALAKEIAGRFQLEPLVAKAEAFLSKLP